MSAFADELDAQLDEIRFGVQAVTPASRDGAGATATVTLLEGTTIDVSLSHRGVRSGDSVYDSVNSLLLNLSPCFAAAFNRSLADALRAVAEESGAEMVADVEEGEGATEEPFPLLPITSQQTLANIRSLAADARTVFIASYPKSGTTWLQNVVYQLVTGGAELDHISTFSPFLEADRTWADGGRVSDPAASHHQRLGWRAFNTHVLHAMLPASPAARLVYVVREPSDACCSMWHHFSHMAPEDGGFTGSLEQFVSQWVAGVIAFGTWRRHVGSWLAAAAADPRVLLLRYEDMIADLAGCVARLSAHLGLGYSDAELGKLLPRMTFAWMKAHEAAFAPTSVAWVDKGDGFSFVRRGKVGGGEEDLTAAQREAIERACWCADDCYSAVIGKEHTLAGLSP